jgi:glycerol-1-phosphate dehydrogenase [NAD(P)+]
MELPRYMRAVSSQDELVRALDELSAGLDFDRLAFVSGTTFTAPLAADLAGAVDRTVGSPLGVETNAESEVARIAASPALREADAVVAVGGGKTIDVAKSACALAELPLIVVPTQLTADGIASPVSVIRDSEGRLRSGSGRLPIAVAVDLAVVAGAPAARTRAGLGDLLANPCALHDWRLAAAVGGEEMDDFAGLLSQSAFDLVHTAAPAGASASQDFLHRLLRGLVLSGLAMEIAGSSRPCSGSEHLISHALDSRHPGTAQHGEQVAFGTLIATRLQGRNWLELRNFMLAAGLHEAARGFGLAADEVVDVVREAPSMRPGRHTVLSEPHITEDVVRGAVAEVLSGA